LILKEDFDEEIVKKIPVLMNNKFKRSEIDLIFFNKINLCTSGVS